VERDLITQRQATNVSYERLVKNRNRDWGLYGIDTGIHPLNMRIGGWIPSKLTTIAGRSGSGKTSLTTPMFIGGSRVHNGKRAEYLFFSWEMDSSYLVDRHISHSTELELKILTQGAKLLDESLMGRVKAAYKEAQKLPVTYQQCSTNIETVKSLSYEFVKECKEKEAIEGVTIQPVIIVDYVSMARFEGSGLRTYGISDFMNGFKQMLNHTSATGLIFAQISRSADDKDMPDRTHIADSQAIEMASDNLIIIHRPEYNGVETIVDPETQIEIDARGKVLMRTLKSRDYGTGDVLINCDIKYFKFWDLYHERNFNYWELYSKEEFWVEYFGLKK
jgi:replicative DNA helicase